MVDEFVESWSLFAQSYIAGWSIALVLALVGVFVIARNQIFVGVAVSQASALGVAIMFWLGSLWGSALRTEHLSAPAAVLFAVGAMLLTSRRQDEGSRESYEALTGWVFLVSSSFSVLLLAHSPHGHAEIQQLLTSTVIGATIQDAYIFGVILFVLALLIFRFHRELLLLSLDPLAAEVSGFNSSRWTLLVSAVLGLVIGLSVPIAGMVYTFGFLVLPPIIAKNLWPEARATLFISPAVALLASTTSFVLANYYDYPPAQLSVAMLCVLAALSRAVVRS